MFKLLPNNRRTLISKDEVISLMASDKDIDPRQIDSAIQIAEERFIKHSICKDFYYDFRDKKNQVVTSINIDFIKTETGLPVKIGDICNAIEFVDSEAYKDLWNEHLCKLTAECVMYIASPTNFSRFTSQGEMENNPKSIGGGAGTATVDLDKMKWKLDKLLSDRIDPLIASLDDWMFDNRGMFPFYNCKKWFNSRYPLDPTQSSVSVKRKTPWIHGIYESLTSQQGCYGCNKDRL